MDFSRITQSVGDYFSANPNMTGLAIAALGVLLFIGTLRGWAWVLSSSGRFNLLRSLFGAKGQMYICSTVIALGEIAVFLLA